MLYQSLVLLNFAVMQRFGVFRTFHERRMKNVNKEKNVLDAIQKKNPFVRIYGSYCFFLDFLLFDHFFFQFGILALALDKIKMPLTVGKSCASFLGQIT